MARAGTSLRARPAGGLFSFWLNSVAVISGKSGKVLRLRSGQPLLKKRRSRLAYAQDDGALNEKGLLFAEVSSGTATARIRQASGFTLLEMMITLTIFILLAAAVFGLMTGVLESTGTLQDNQNRKDKTVAFNAYLKKKLGEMPVGSTLTSYQRGDGEGLTQNGIVFGSVYLATAIDATAQDNSLYTLRVTTMPAGQVGGQQQDARQLLLTAVTANDPSLAWTPLIKDIKTLGWKFLDFNQTVWVEVWNSGANPNLVEFTMQPAGDLLPTTMDFWLPKIDAVQLNIAPQARTP